MTYLNQLMRARRLTKAELSRQSGIPETTLRDLLSGSVRLENARRARFSALRAPSMFPLRNS